MSDRWMESAARIATSLSYRCACAFASTAKFLNLHLKAIPILDSHTTEKSFNMLVKFFDALYEP